MLYLIAVFCYRLHVILWFCSEGCPLHIGALELAASFDYCTLSAFNKIILLR